MRSLVIALGLALLVAPALTVAAGPYHTGTGTWVHAGVLGVQSRAVNAIYTDTGAQFLIDLDAGAAYVRAYFAQDVSNGGVFTDNVGCRWTTTHFHTNPALLTRSCVGLGGEDAFRLAFAQEP